MSVRALPGTGGRFRRPAAGYARDGTLSELAERREVAACLH